MAPASSQSDAVVEQKPQSTTSKVLNQAGPDQRDQRCEDSEGQDTIRRMLTSALAEPAQLETKLETVAERRIPTVVMEAG